MNETLKTLRNRRSVRKYQARQITDAELNAILDAGLWAASGHGLQTPVMVVIQDAETLEKLEKANAASAYVTIPAVCTKVEMGGDNDISMVEEGIAFSPVYHIALKKTISKGGFTTWLKLQKAN